MQVIEKDNFSDTTLVLEATLLEKFKSSSFSGLIMFLVHEIMFKNTNKWALIYDESIYHSIYNNSSPLYV